MQQGPLLHRRYPASTLLRTQPPPSRLQPISRGHRLYDLPCSRHFCLGRGRLLQLLGMSLSPCCPYHPTGVTRRDSQIATSHAAFARKERARPPDLSKVGGLAIKSGKMRPRNENGNALHSMSDSSSFEETCPRKFLYRAISLAHADSVIE